MARFTAACLMMLAGQYVTPRGMIALSVVHGEEEARGLLLALGEFLSAYGDLLPSHGAQRRGIA